MTEPIELHIYQYSSKRHLAVGDVWKPVGTHYNQWTKITTLEPTRTVTRLVDTDKSVSNGVKVYYTDSNGKLGRCGQKTFAEWVHLWRARREERPLD